MTTLRGENDDYIGYTLSDTIHDYAADIHIIETPTIVCNNRKNAEIIQKEINSFVSELSRAILEKRYK